MKIELNKNKVFFNDGSNKEEIHPLWLRERVNDDKFLDKSTQQRLFDPTSLKVEIGIKKVEIQNNFLEIDFSDGVNSKLEIINIIEESLSKIKTHNINNLEDIFIIDNNARKISKQIIKNGNFK